MDIYINATKISFITGNIAWQDTDAIVNSSNASLQSGDLVDLSIRRAAGPELAEECRELVQRSGWCPVGNAVVTGAGRLKAEYVVHAVGPIWFKGNPERAEQLRSAYRNALLCAERVGARSVAIPSIGTDLQGVPFAVGSRIAVSTVFEYLQGGSSIEEIRFVLSNNYEVSEYRRHFKYLMSDAKTRKAVVCTNR